MARRRRTRVVFHRCNPLIKAVILVAIVLSTAALVMLRASIDEVHSQYEAMRLQAAALEAANEELTIYIDDLGSVESAERIAMEELGLVYPGTTIFDPATD